MLQKNAEKSISAAREVRAKKAAPFYLMAFSESISDDVAKDLLKDPVFAAANKAIQSKPVYKKELLNFPKNSLKRFHLIKTEIDNNIGQNLTEGRATEAKLLMDSKMELLELLDDISPEYKLARQIFSSESQDVAGLTDGMIIRSS